LEQQHTNYYNLHGLRLAVSTSDSHLGTVLHARLRQWSAPPDSLSPLHFDFRCMADSARSGLPKPGGRTRVVFELPRIGGVVLYAEEEDRLYMQWGEHVGGVCHLGQGYAQAFYTPSAKDNLWRVSHALFMFSLSELLKRQGRYSLHAAGLCLNDRGLLLPGSSGSGKTTLAIALLRTGFGFLADDTVFLLPTPEGLHVLAFPDEIDVTENTVQLFPELHELLQVPLVSGRTKRQIWSEAVYGVDFVPACRPAVLVFPRVANVAHSTLQPLRRDEALLELMPNILLTERRASQAHFDVLAELVRQSDCYRLETGRDVEALPALLAGLVSCPWACSTGYPAAYRPLLQSLTRKSNCYSAVPEPRWTPVRPNGSKRWSSNP
jgi:hypothetical protein